MIARGKRLPITLAILALVLVLGRWTSGFLAHRWWLASISAEAEAFGARWSLVSLGLGLLGTFTVFAFLVVQWLGTLRGVIHRAAAPAAPRHIGLASFHEPSVRWGTVAVAAVIAWLFGTDLSRWTGMVLLAVEGVDFGVNIPGAGGDVGFYLTQLPLLGAAQGWLVGTLLLCMLGSAGMYAVWGELRFGSGRIVIEAPARRHLGILSAAFALLLAAGFLLAPAQALADPAGLLGLSDVSVVRVVSYLLAGVAVAVALLTLVWAGRGPHVLLVSGWAVFAAAWLIGRAVVPTGSAASGDPANGEARVTLERIAFGLESENTGSAVHAATGWIGPTPFPSLWDRVALRQMVPGDSTGYFSAARGTLDTGADSSTSVWWLLWGDSTTLRMAPISDERVGEGGQSITIGRDGTSSAGVVSWRTVSGDAVRPAAPLVVLDGAGDNGTGLRVGGFLRRVVFAWALQSSRILGVHPAVHVSWTLDPAERTRAVAPFADWSEPRLEMLDGSPVWVVRGTLVSDRMPLTHRVPWRGQRVGHAREAFVALVPLDRGTVTIHLLPSAGPLADAWASIAGPLILREPPQALLTGPSPEWVRAMASRRGVPIGEGEMEAPVIAVGSLPPRESSLVGFVEHSGFSLSWRPTNALSNGFQPASLERRWNQLRFFQQVRDSVRASGGVLTPGAIRYRIRGEEALAYRPWYGMGSGRGAHLAVVTVAGAIDLGVGRTLPEAISALQGDSIPGMGDAPRSVLEEVRLWMTLADSALRRGDLATFARAFQAMRDLVDQ